MTGGHIFLTISHYISLYLTIPPYLHRPEYWVVTKDVAGGPRRGDELSFRLDTDGSVVSTLL